MQGEHKWLYCLAGQTRLDLCKLVADFSFLARGRRALFRRLAVLAVDQLSLKHPH